MKELFPGETELSTLIALALEDRLHPTQVKRLNTLLRERADARQYYVKSIAIHVSMSQMQNLHMVDKDSSQDDHHILYEQISQDLTESAIREALTESNARSSTRSSSPSLSQWRSPNRKELMRFLRNAAAIILFSIALIWLDRELWKRSQSVPPMPVAQLTQLIGVLESESTGHHYYSGKAIYSEVCTLSKDGFVELIFPSQVRAVVEGPARFEIPGFNQVHLLEGKLFAHVPTEGIGFTINSPSARIVDLGTEFGLEVWADGATDVYTYEGKVQLVGHSSRREIDKPVIVSADEARQVDHSGQTISHLEFDTQKFVRQFDSKSNFIWRGHRTLDLADVVGGGNGFGSGQLGHVITLDTGKVTSKSFYRKFQQGVFNQEKYYNNQKIFTAVPSLPFVDGLFLPDGGARTVQIAEAGLHFAGFPDTGGQTYGDAANGGQILHSHDRVSDLILGGKTYGTRESPAIYMHANLGITFDLAAIRHSMGDVKKIMRFTSRCGLSESVLDDPVYQNTQNSAIPSADFWVLVDGQVAFKRRGVRVQADGATDIEIELNHTNRYLTLTVTDGNSDNSFDWGLFVEPVLELE